MTAYGPEVGVARDLETAGFGVFDESGSTGTIFVGEEPKTPNNIVVVLNAVGGRLPSVVSEEWLLTVRVRDELYEAAHRRLREIAIHLQEKGQGDFGGVRAGRLAPESTPVTLGRDENRRWRVEQIFSMLLKRSFSFVS